MTLPHRPRGRPKGSGINDRQRLRDIAALVMSQPHIKPTTAIKMLGEHDPSVIRRLRDKFYSLQGELVEEVRTLRTAPAVATAGSSQSGYAALAQPHPSMPPLSMLRFDGSVRANVSAVGSDTMTRMTEIGQPSRRPEPTQPASAVGHGMCGATDPTPVQCALGEFPNGTTVTASHSTAVSELEGDRARLAELAAYNLMLGFAIQATVNAMGHQAKVAEEPFRTQPVAALLKQQIAIGEMVMAMTWPGGQSRFELPRLSTVPVQA